MYLRRVENWKPGIARLSENQQKLRSAQDDSVDSVATLEYGNYRDESIPRFGGEDVVKELAHVLLVDILAIGRIRRRDCQTSTGKDHGIEARLHRRSGTEQHRLPD